MDSLFDDRPRRRRTSVLGVLALLIVIVGGVNWGLVGLADYDMVAATFGAGTRLSRIIYALVGLAAVYCVLLLPRAARSG